MFQYKCIQASQSPYQREFYWRFRCQLREEPQRANDDTATNHSSMIDQRSLFNRLHTSFLRLFAQIISFSTIYALRFSQYTIITSFFTVLIIRLVLSDTIIRFSQFNFFTIIISNIILNPIQTVILFSYIYLLIMNKLNIVQTV